MFDQTHAPLYHHNPQNFSPHYLYDEHMHVEFGPGLLKALPYNKCQREEDAISFALQFAQLNLSNQFVDVINQRVASFTYTYNGGQMCWLNNQQAAPIINAHHQAGGQIPYEIYEAFHSDVTLYLPNMHTQHVTQIQQGHDLEGWTVAPLGLAILTAQTSLLLYQDDANAQAETAFLTQILDELNFCNQHHLPYFFRN